MKVFFFQDLQLLNDITKLHYSNYKALHSDGQVDQTSY
jgi:hypothetical protein